jgi:hypothetical protein
VRAFFKWCADHDHSPALDRELMKAFVADLLDAGAEAATARSRQLGMRRFSVWFERRGHRRSAVRHGVFYPSRRFRAVANLTARIMLRINGFHLIAWRE